MSDFYPSEEQEEDPYREYAEETTAMITTEAYRTELERKAAEEEAAASAWRNQPRRRLTEEEKEARDARLLAEYEKNKGRVYTLPASWVKGPSSEEKGEETETEDEKESEEQIVYSGSKEPDVPAMEIVQEEEKKSEAPALKRKQPLSRDTYKNILCVTCFERRFELKENGKYPSEDSYLIRSLSEEHHWKVWHNMEITKMFNPEATEPEVLHSRDLARSVKNDDGTSQTVADKIERLRSDGIVVWVLTDEERVQLRDLFDALATPGERDGVIQYFIETHTLPTLAEAKSSSSSSSSTSMSLSPIPRAPSSKSRDLSLSILRSDSLKSSLFSSDFPSSVSSALSEQSNRDTRLGLSYLSYYSAAGLGKSDEDQTNRRIEFLRELVKTIKIKRSELKRNRADLFNRYSPLVSANSAIIIDDDDGGAPSSPVSFSLDGFKRFVRQMEELSLRFVVAFQDKAFTRTHAKRLMSTEDKESLFAALQETALLAYNVASYEYSITAKKTGTLPAVLNTIRNEGRKAYSWIKELHSAFESFDSEESEFTQLSRLFGFMARSYAIQYNAPRTSVLLERMKQTVEYDVDDLRDYFYLVMERTDVNPLNTAEIDKLLADLSQFEKNYSEVYQSNFVTAELYSAILSYLLNSTGKRGKETSQVFWFESFYILAIRSLRVGNQIRTSPFTPPALKKEALALENSEIARGIAFRFSSQQQQTLGTAVQELEKEEKQEIEEKRPEKRAKTPKSPGLGGFKAQQRQLAQHKQRLDDLFSASKSSSSSSSSSASVPTRQVEVDELPAPLESSGQRKKKKVILEEEEDEDEYQDDLFGASPEYVLRKHRSARAKQHELYFGHHSEYISLRQSRSPEQPY